MPFEIVCIHLYLSYFRLYLKEFGDTARPLVNLINFQDIEMESTAFERELYFFFRCWSHFDIFKNDRLPLLAYFRNFEIAVSSNPLRYKRK